MTFNVPVYGRSGSNLDKGKFFFFSVKAREREYAAASRDEWRFFSKRVAWHKFGDDRGSTCLVRPAGLYRN